MDGDLLGLGAAAFFLTNERLYDTVLHEVSQEVPVAQVLKQIQKALIPEQLGLSGTICFSSL